MEENKEEEILAKAIHGGKEELKKEMGGKLKGDEGVDYEVSEVIVRSGGKHGL
ncbi:hypothetical protein [Cytobacillus oceanisediminis]|uniref:hypothetical protein n=1 Tax=Cytobacillus oceanisediminis TaxID=665099 RepID=UPI0016434222|nr:hypothetical protein [Cytobacillus oceanisediminis]